MIEVFQSDDWICVKVNGKVVVEDHSLTNPIHLHAIANALGVDYKRSSMYYGEDDYEAQERFQAKLEEFKGE